MIRFSQGAKDRPFYGVIFPSLEIQAAAHSTQSPHTTIDWLMSSLHKPPIRAVETGQRLCRNRPKTLMIDWTTAGQVYTQ